MKLLALILVIMIAALPVQTGFCDMQPSGGENPHMAMQHLLLVLLLEWWPWEWKKSTFSGT